MNINHKADIDLDKSLRLLHYDQMIFESGD